jgi:hypothetical protein
MTQKPLAIAALLGALIIAAALVYHGRQLAEVSRRLEAMEQRTTGLDSRLDRFSSELPVLVGQAGNNAGRQAVHGAVDELIQMPRNWLNSKLTSGGSAATNNAVLPSSSRDSTADQGTPWIRFDIREPVVTIQILPNLKEVPAIPWLPTDGMKQPSPQTNHAGSTVVPPKLGTEAK